MGQLIIFQRSDQKHSFRGFAFARDTPSTAVNRLRAVSSVVEDFIYTDGLTNSPKSSSLDLAPTGVLFAVSVSR